MEIVVSLTANTGSFNTDFNRTAKELERTLKKMEAESKKSLANVQKNFQDTGNKLKGFVAGFLTVGALVGVFRSVVRATAESEKASQNLESALRGTRGATAETASQLKAYAEELQRTTIFEDDAIVSAQALLATFRNISANEIPRAVKAAADLSAAFGRDLKSSAELVGRALNDPTKATRSLREAHVALSPALQKTIKELVETGRTAEAQNIVLQEFERTVGGRAVDATKTLGGALAQLKNAFGNLLEAGGTDDAVASINQLTEVLQSPSTKRAFATFTKLLTDAAAAAVKFGSDVVNAIAGVNNVQLLGEKPQGFAENLLERLPDNIETAVRAMLSLRRATLDVIEEIDKLSPKLLLVNEARASQTFSGLIQRTGGPSTPQGDGLITNAITPRFLSDAQLREAEKARQEARRLQEAIAQGSAEIFQAQLDRERQALDASLDLRLISYQGYLNEKLRLTEAEIDAEIAASEALLQGAAADEAAILQARIQTLEIQREIARESKTQEEAKHAQELADAYEDAARAAKSYVDEISRQGQRELLLLDLSPKDRRFAGGQFQIDDQFRSEQEQLDPESEDYEERLQLLKDHHAQASSEWAKYFELIEAKQNDFSTSFNNSIQEYVDATQNVGAALGDTFVHAIDEAIAGTSRLAAEWILFGEGGKDAIYQLARSIATQLLQALIQAGIQLAINKLLADAFAKSMEDANKSASGGGQSTGSQLGSLFGTILEGLFAGPGKAGGGYTGDIPENEIADFVHGKEFVVNADATRQNRGLLEAINSGNFSADAVSVPRSSGQGIKSDRGIRIINVPDKTYIKDYLMGDEGDEVFTNWVGRNSSRIKQAVAS